MRLDGVRKAFGTGRRAVVALDGVDLAVAPGEFVCLLGASGCGKTTLLNLVAGLDAPSAGEIELNTSRPAVMFQEAALMPWLTAARNVELPLRLAGVRRSSPAPAHGRAAGPGAAGRGRRQASARAVRRHAPAGRAGPRAGLGRARSPGTASNALLLMDEPFSALDAITRDVLQAELLRVWRATGTAVLFVTHDVREAVRLGQRVVLLSSRPGQVVQRVDRRRADDRRRRGGRSTRSTGDCVR